MITTDTCLFCDGDTESVEHALLECSRSASIWFSSPLCLRTERHIYGAFRMWLVKVARLLAHQSFDLALILIWNGTALNQVDINCKSQASLQEYRKLHGSKKCSRPSIPQKWEKPDVGWLKCNFDGTWDELGELGGIGGVIRDDNGALWQLQQ